MCVAAPGLAGSAHAGTGCPCEKKQACNDCCSVEHGTARSRSSSIMSVPTGRHVLTRRPCADGKHYGPHCRKGVCGSGAFPQEHDKKWSPETQRDDNTEWGNYWKCPAGDTTPEHGADL